MIPLAKSIHRVVHLDPKLGGKAAGPIVVTLSPEGHGSITFRQLRSRHEVRLPLSNCYAMALKAEAALALKEKKRRKVWG